MFIDYSLITCIFIFKILFLYIKKDFYFILNLFWMIFIKPFSFLYIRINTLVYIYFGIVIREYDEEVILDEFDVIFMSGDELFRW